MLSSPGNIRSISWHQTHVRPACWYVLVSMTDTVGQLHPESLNPRRPKKQTPIPRRVRKHTGTQPRTRHYTSPHTGLREPRVRGVGFAQKVLQSFLLKTHASIIELSALVVSYDWVAVKELIL